MTSKTDIPLPLYLLLTSLLACTVFLSAQWRELIRLWYTGSTYTHGFLVLAACLYLIWQKRASLRTLTTDISWTALPALVILDCVLILSSLADINVLTLLCLPFYLLVCIWLVLGRQGVLLLAPIVLLLLFGIPLWDDFSPVLQIITVYTNDLLLSAAGIPATIHELYITIPQGTFYVAGGCSGIRYTIVALFISCVYSLLYIHSFRKRFYLVILSLFVSMLANWLRVFGIIVTGYMTDMQSSLIEDHETFGWVVFAVVFVLPFTLFSRRLDTPEPAVIAGDAMPSSVSLTLPEKVIFCMGILLPLLVPLTLYRSTHQAQDSTAPFWKFPPKGTLLWNGPLIQKPMWQPDFSNTDIRFDAYYIKGTDHKIQFSVAGYLSQSQGRELVYFSNRLYSPGAWEEHSNLITTSPLAVLKGGYRDTLLQHKKDNTFLRIWSWYSVGNTMTPSPVYAKLAGALNKISDRPEGAVIATAIYCERKDICMGASPVLEDFIRFLTETDYLKTH